MKKAVSVFLCIILSVSFVLGLDIKTEAATIEESYVQNKIASLKTLFPDGSYFTVDGKNSCHENVVYGSNYSYCYSTSCQQCKLENVLKKNSKAKNTIVPSVCTLQNKYSCCGFAAFAFCYIFEHDLTDSKTTTFSSGSGGITEEFLSKLKKGDHVQCYTSTTSSEPAHYNIFLGYDSKYVYFYESNYDSPNQVEYMNARPRVGNSLGKDGKWKKLVVHRSKNYEAITSESEEIKDYYKLTSPDGYQTMRSSYSTSSNKILDITIPAIVCVTKYSPDDKWGYITYNGKSGWIRLYYVEKHNHSYGAWQTTKAATCTTTGTKKQTCECGLYKTSKIDALGHKFSAWKTTKNATCTVNGEKKRTCSVCSFSEKGTVSATGHNYSGEWTIDKAASCVNNGQKSHHCLNCDSKIDITNISPVGHNFGEWKTIKEATTKASGKTQRNCKNSGCSEVETKTIAKLAEDGHSHKFGNWEIKKDATCVKEGSKERKCEICSESESMSIAGKGHTFGESIVTKEATETEKGIKTKTCTVCNVTEEEEIPYLTAEPENDEKTDAVVDNDKAVVDIDKKEGSNNIFWIIIAIAAVVLIGGGVTAVILIKKKK